MTYWVGESRFHTVAFTDSTGAATAMSDVSLTVTDPAGVDTAYNAPTNTGTGTYRQLVEWDAAGIWFWTWTGTVTATEEVVIDSGSVCVKDVP